MTCSGLNLHQRYAKRCSNCCDIKKRYTCVDINYELSCKCELEKTNDLKDSFGIESDNSFGIR